MGITNSSPSRVALIQQRMTGPNHLHEGNFFYKMLLQHQREMRTIYSYTRSGSISVSSTHVAGDDCMSEEFYAANLNRICGVSQAGQVKVLGWWSWTAMMPRSRNVFDPTNPRRTLQFILVADEHTDYMAHYRSVQETPMYLLVVHATRDQLLTGSLPTGAVNYGNYLRTLNITSAVWHILKDVNEGNAHMTNASMYAVGEMAWPGIAFTMLEGMQANNCCDYTREAISTALHPALWTRVLNAIFRFVTHTHQAVPHTTNGPWPVATPLLQEPAGLIPARNPMGSDTNWFLPAGLTTAEAVSWMFSRGLPDDIPMANCLICGASVPSDLMVSRNMWRYDDDGYSTPVTTHGLICSHCCDVRTDHYFQNPTATRFTSDQLQHITVWSCYHCNDAMDGEFAGDHMATIETMNGVRDLPLCPNCEEHYSDCEDCGTLFRSRTTTGLCSTCRERAREDEEDDYEDEESYNRGGFRPNHPLAIAPSDVHPREGIVQPNWEAINQQREACATDDATPLRLDWCWSPDTLNFHPDKPATTKPPLYIGLELEIAFPNYDCRDAAEHWLHLNLEPDLFWTKSDGSVHRGFELVTHPFQPTWGLENVDWDRFQNMIDICKAYPEHPSTGGHIHMSEDAWDSAALWKLLTLHKKLYLYCALIGGRDANSYYGSFTSRNGGPVNLTGKQIADTAKAKRWALHNGPGGHYTYADRYVAVNLNPENTIELRYPAGTIVPTRIRKNIQWVQALWTFCNSLSVKRFKEVTADSIAFHSWLMEHKDEWPDLGAWITQLEEGGHIPCA